MATIQRSLGALLCQCLLIPILSGSHAVASTGAPVLWYLQPASLSSGMNEALPIGNGRLGALVYGGVSDDRMVFDDSSLWTGDANPSGDYGTMGSYQKFGEVDVNLAGQHDVRRYRRDLDLRAATAHVSYDVAGVHFRREYFASHPAQVVVVRYTADKPRSYTGSIALVGAHSDKTTIDGRTMTFTGKLTNGIAYEAELKVIVDGGVVSLDGGSLKFDHANGLTLILAGASNYVPNYAAHYLGSDPHGKVAKQISHAEGQPYAALLHAHVVDYRGLFDRVRLSLGRSTPDRAALPTDARKILAEQGDDPEMEELLFQYGRYLMIAASRPGGLPANLQGIWNDSNTPPWDSDYHTDLNIEMNYWPVEAANLSECATPLFDLVDSQIPSWRTLTQAAPEYKVASGKMPSQGFDMRASFNITGGMGWLWIKTSDAWLLQSYWEHYAFTGDKVFLRDRAYPLLKETSELWLEELKPLPDGRLVVPSGWSPEHGGFEDGVSFNQELVWDLFTNAIEASEALGIDADFRTRVESARAKLYEPGIGRWGQIKEWMEDKDDPNDNHRHTSELIGVYPGRLYSVQSTPGMMKAAKVTLIHRGDSGDAAEWSFAWRTALFARTHDGDNAHRQVAQFFAARNSLVNLFGFLTDVNPPVMQVDGDYGITAGMCEMLLQSQNHEIELLPALPAAWPAGSVTGLRARGDFTVDETWKRGKLVNAIIHGRHGSSCRVRYGAKSTTVTFTSTDMIKLGPELMH